MTRIALSMTVSSCLVLAGSATGQRFQQVYGTPETSEQAVAVDNTSDGGYVTTGWSRFGGTAPADMLVSRYDALGNILWSKRYDVGQDERGYSIRELSDGYIVAGTIVGGQAPDAEILVSRLDTAGNVVWSRRFAGTAGTDAVNRPNPGVSIAVIENEAGFVVVGNRFGRPSALIISPDGMSFVARDYEFFNPNSDVEPDLQVGFTDLVEVGPGSDFAIVGTARSFTPFAPNGQLDVFLMPIDLGLNPLGAFLFSSLDPMNPDAPHINETGDGIDFDRGRNSLYIAGRTNAGPQGAAGGDAPHLLTVDPSLPGFITDWQHTFVGFPTGEPLPIAWETGYAAVEYDDESDFIGVGGLWMNPGGMTAGLLEYDAGGGLRGVRSYGSSDPFGMDTNPVAAGEDVVKGRDCGWLVAGRNDLSNFAGATGPFVTPPLGEYLVKTNDALNTACFEADVPLVRAEVEFRFAELEFNIADRDEVRDVPLDPIDITPNTDVLCADPECIPCPCPGDTDGDGDIDATDFIFILVNYNKIYDEQCNVIGTIGN
ncbi:MAG: hypothetical protein AAGI30_08260 [Planctomycetota bacterium]